MNRCIVIIIVIVCLFNQYVTCYMSVGNSNILSLRRMKSPTTVLTSTISSSSLTQFNKPVTLRLPSDQLTIARLAICGLLGLTYLHSTDINSMISLLWDNIKVNKFFMNDMWEPFVAVSSFFIWIHGFYYAEKFLPGIQRFRISKIASNSKIASSSSNISKSDNKNLSPWYSHWLFRELPVYLVPLYFLSVHFDAFAFRRNALQQAAPTIWRIGREIVGGLFFYDLFFFFTHWPLHNSGNAIYKLGHHRHHSNKEVRAVDTIKLTTLEEFVDVLCSVMALRILNAHPISRTLYNIVITGLLSELHCGYDFPLSPQNLVPFKLWAGSKRHHVHHQNGRYYFQKFFTYLDNFFGLVEKSKIN